MLSWGYCWLVIRGLRFQKDGGRGFKKDGGVLKMGG